MEWNLLPDGISLWFGSVLVLASFVTSAISAAFGLGGGIVLLALMGLSLPVAALIPVHGAVQFCSNAGRTFLLRRNITPWVFLWFSAGTISGALIASQLVVTISESVWRFSLGVFLLLITWLSKPAFGRTARPVVFLNGIGGAVLTVFFGATGPFVAAINSQHSPTRQGVVATHAASMTLQHLVKIFLFGFLGFAFAPWIPLIAAMVITGYLGTIFGARFLEKLSEQLFRQTLKWLITTLALVIIAQVWV